MPKDDLSRVLQELLNVAVYGHEKLDFYTVSILNYKADLSTWKIWGYIICLSKNGTLNGGRK